MAVQFVQPHRFSADQYRRMTEIGVVPANGTELIDGVVVEGTRPFRFTSEDYFRLGREGFSMMEIVASCWTARSSRWARSAGVTPGASRA
jgi:hypothetical protein